MSGQARPTHGATLAIDLGALAGNWRHLRDRVAPAECAAVVKADAYGIGIEPAVRTLARAGCRTFFVAHIGEAARLRAVAREAVVYVLNGLPPGSADDFLAIGARPILGSFEELADWATASTGRGTRLSAALHVDTGMNRLGFAPSEAAAVAADPRLGAIDPVLMMSHLTSAEDHEADSATERQAETFAAVRATLPFPASLANSSGIFHPAVPPLALARPGYALYGGNPTPGRPNPMHPVVRLEAWIVQLRDVEAGATVGYNGRWTAPGPRRLATLSVGYADGYPRAAGGTDLNADLPTGAALVAGRLCPFVGRVSMDLVVLDVTEVPSGDAVRGAPVTLIGDALDLDEVGRRAGTIGYEILTGLGPRYLRRYVNG
ncbi:alanine racemase [uncultured Enterovirga sp.]|uniref:alanine racemase n=1 Tax=uncultured Enterovirga sp. TaxID=2026352 RepID=UPI0035CAE0A0